MMMNDNLFLKEWVGLCLKEIKESGGDGSGY